MLRAVVLSLHVGTDAVLPASTTTQVGVLAHVSANVTVQLVGAPVPVVILPLISLPLMLGLVPHVAPSEGVVPELMM